MVPAQCFYSAAFPFTLQGAFPREACLAHSPAGPKGQGQSGAGTQVGRKGPLLLAKPKGCCHTLPILKSATEKKQTESMFHLSLLTDIFQIQPMKGNAKKEGGGHRFTTFKVSAKATHLMTTP